MSHDLYQRFVPNKNHRLEALIHFLADHQVQLAHLRRLNLHKEVPSDLIILLQFAIIQRHYPFQEPFLVHLDVFQTSLDIQYIDQVSMKISDHVQILPRANIKVTHLYIDLENQFFGEQSSNLLSS